MFLLSQLRISHFILHTMGAPEDSRQGVIWSDLVPDNLFWKQRDLHGWKETRSGKPALLENDDGILQAWAHPGNNNELG